MVSVFDVAAYIIKQQGSVTTWKLQKLVYYSQAWSLVWDEKPLFPEEIQAWINGPVCPALYEKHKGKFEIAGISSGNPLNLNKYQKETVDAVLDLYGPHPSHWLSNLTHMEPPWKNARQGLSMRERGSSVITHDSMAEYYESILPDDSVSC